MAKIYAKERAQLVIMARRKEELNVVVDECKKLGAESVLSLTVDVANEEDVKKAVERIGKLLCCSC